MKVILVVGHPAHVYLFRYVVSDLKSRGHTVSIAAVEKESTLELLRRLELPYDRLGRNMPNLVSKALDLPIKDFRFARYISRIRPDLVASVSSPYSAQACKALSVPHIAFTDTEVARIILRLTVPFSEVVCTPDCFELDLGPKQLRYRGYHELAYLHPKRFKPDPGVLRSIGVRAGDPLVVVRLSSWNSSHDLDDKGRARSSDRELPRILSLLSNYARVVISSERGLSPHLGRLEATIPLEEIHSLLYYASLYMGEGATMASESGVLGTPWVFVSPQSRGYLNDQQNTYGLGFCVRSWEAGLKQALAILSDSDSKAKWVERRNRLLRDKIDVTEFIVDLVDRWPEGIAGRHSSSQLYGNSRLERLGR